MSRDPSSVVRTRLGFGGLRVGVQSLAFCVFVAASGRAEQTVNGATTADGVRVHPAGEPSSLLHRTQEALTRIAADVRPCVVALQITPRRTLGRGLIPPAPYGRPWTRSSHGSGLIVSPAGEILTNAHVIRSAERIQVTIHTGESFTAKILGADLRSDLAVLKINAGRALPVCTFGDSRRVRLGQLAIALGNPFGLDGTITLGVISATDRSLPLPNRMHSSTDVYYGRLLQTDAAINPGNSGGPLVDIDGRVVGVTVLIFTRSRGGQGVGFAIPSETILHHLPYLRAGKPVDYGYLGVEPKDLIGELAEAFGVKPYSGTLINNVEPGMPANIAGLRPGMIITRFNGRPVRSSDDLRHLAGLAKPHRETTITIRLPAGAEKVLKITPTSRARTKTFAELEAEETAASPRPPEKQEGYWRGLRVKDLNKRERARHGSGASVDRVLRLSPAARAGLGLFDEDVIKAVGTSANDMQPVKGAKAFRKLAGELAGVVLLKLSRSGYVAVPEE